MRRPIGVPGDAGTIVGEGCGGREPGSLKVITWGSGSRHGYGLAYGTTPDQAAQVRVEARGLTATVKTLDDNAGLNGRFYVAELPVTGSLGATTVSALDHDGKVIARTAVGRPVPLHPGASRFDAPH